MTNTSETDNLFDDSIKTELVGTDSSTKIINLGNGGYGCVHYNEKSKCSIKSDVTKQTVLEDIIKYVDKIQSIKDVEIDFLKNDMGKSLVEKSEIPYIQGRLTSIGRGFINEFYFGKIIQKIPNYYMYFAPVLSYCDFHIENVPPITIEVCPLINKTDFFKTKYVITKIQYIEGITLFSYFKTLSNPTISLETDTLRWSEDTKNTEKLALTTKRTIPSIFIKRFTETYRYLMKSIQLLQKSPNPESIIIHYDLKDQNIIYDKKRGIPIIIDFGISFNKKDLFEYKLPRELISIFYNNNKPPCWCLDIVLLAHLLHDTPGLLINSKYEMMMGETGKTGKSGKTREGEDTEDTEDTGEGGAVEELINICDRFIDENKIFIAIERLRGSENKFREKMKSEWRLYIESFKEKTWHQFIDDLIKRYEYWDVYSISICYLDYLYTIGFLNGDYEIPEIVNELIHDLHMSDLVGNELQNPVTR